MLDPSRKIRIVFVSVVALLLAVLWLAALVLARHQALNELAAETDALARQHGRVIDSELARFRLLPIVLSEYGDLAAVLATPTTDDERRLSEKLRGLAGKTGASVLYLLNRTGRAVVGSNFDRPDSFVGQEFAFRPYFSRAMAEGATEYFGAGVLTGRPGLFLARRLGERPDRALGVVVVKYEFATLTQNWGGDPGETLITDERGIILAAADPSQLLTTVMPLSTQDRQAIEASGQYGTAALREGRYRWLGPDRMLIGGTDEAVMVTVPVAGTNLRLLHLMKTAPALRAATYRAWGMAVPIVAGGVLIALLLWNRLTRAARLAADRRALEQAVSERTQQLQEEMGKRELADQRFRDTREELEQANRLASVGSIAAGLMHEINQPVATIRTLSENACHHLAANRLEKVKNNLDVTIAMTERIATLTQEMRRFARRKHGQTSREPLEGVIAGALLLVEDRLRRQGVRLEVPTGELPQVLAERVRLEQVLVNLLQNALDAVADVPAPAIALTVEQREDCVVLTVADNGPGIDPVLGKQIFLPFVTGKPDGLGLGLGIAQDIMVDLGGMLAVVESPLGGAALAMTMRTA